MPTTEKHYRRRMGKCMSSSILSRDGEKKDNTSETVKKNNGGDGWGLEDDIRGGRVELGCNLMTKVASSPQRRERPLGNEQGGNKSLRRTTAQ